MPTSLRNVASSAPLGPSTLTVRSLTCTFTLAGTTMGCFPILDTALSSPHLAQQFATDLLRSGLAITHHTTACAQHRNAETVQHRNQLVVANVNSQARLARAFQV